MNWMNSGETRMNPSTPAPSQPTTPTKGANQPPGNALSPPSPPLAPTPPDFFQSQETPGQPDDGMTTAETNSFLISFLDQTVFEYSFHTSPPTSGEFKWRVFTAMTELRVGGFYDPVFAIALFDGLNTVYVRSVLFIKEMVVPVFDPTTKVAQCFHVFFSAGRDVNTKLLREFLENETKTEIHEPVQRGLHLMETLFAVTFTDTHFKSTVEYDGHELNLILNVSNPGSKSISEERDSILDRVVKETTVLGLLVPWRVQIAVKMKRIGMLFVTPEEPRLALRGSKNVILNDNSFGWMPEPKFVTPARIGGCSFVCFEKESQDLNDLIAPFSKKLSSVCDRYGFRIRLCSPIFQNALEVEMTVMKAISLSMDQKKKGICLLVCIVPDGNFAKIQQINEAQIAYNKVSSRESNGHRLVVHILNQSSLNPIEPVGLLNKAIDLNCDAGGISFAEYISPIALRHWSVAVFGKLSNNPDAIVSLVRDIRRMSYQRGMKMNGPTIFFQNGLDVESFLERATMIELHGTQFDAVMILCVVQKNDFATRNRIQRYADCKLKILAPCVDEESLKLRSRGYLLNLSMKLNTMLGGINFIVSDLGYFGLKSSKTMLVAATKLFPKSLKAVSIESVVASVDQNFAKYNSATSIQGPMETNINSLDVKMRELLLKYCNVNGFPRQIVFFRNGVLRSDELHVSRTEVNLLKQVLRKEGIVDCKVIYVVVRDDHGNCVFTDRNTQTKAGTVVTLGNAPRDFLLFHSSATSVRYSIMYNDTKCDALELKKFCYRLPILDTIVSSGSEIPAVRYVRNIAERSMSYCDNTDAGVGPEAFIEVSEKLASVMYYA